MNNGRMKKKLDCVRVLSISLLLGLSAPSLGEEIEENPQQKLSQEEPAADEFELLAEEIPSVFAASRYEQKITDAPAYVTIVTAADIRNFGYRTLGDILKSVQSFYVTNDRNYEYAGVRGFQRPGDYNTRILLMVNGHRTNNNIYESAMIGTEFILDVDLIERIEIIRGPSSSLYGTSAFFAVLNVITKKGRDLQGFQVIGDFGSRDTYKGQISYGKNFLNGLEMLVSGSVLDSQGSDLYFKEFDSPSTNFGIAKELDKDRVYQLFSKFSYEGFSLTTAWSFRRKTIPTAAWETLFNDPHMFSIDEQAFSDFRFEHAFNPKVQFLARIYLDYYRYSGEYPYNMAEEGDPIERVINKDYAYGTWWGGELQFTVQFLDWLKAIGGFEVRHDIHQDQGNYDAENTYLHDDRSAYVLSGYFQAEVEIIKSLILFGGLRYDFYETFGGTFNPRLTLVYRPVEKTTLKLCYGNAFSAPNAYQLYYNDGNQTQKANPLLEPERIMTVEAIWEQSLTRGLRSILSLYRYQIRDLIDLTKDPNGLSFFQNTGTLVSSHGLELSIEGKLPSGWEGAVGYGLQLTTADSSADWMFSRAAWDPRSNSNLTNSPRHMAKASVVVPLRPEKLFGGVELQYLSSRQTLSGGLTRDVFLANLSLVAPDVLKGLSLSAHVYNLFGYVYGDPGSPEHTQTMIMQNGRTFFVRLGYVF
jgi:outer membrane receptor for ferrienterochelin and colicins